MKNATAATEKVIASSLTKENNGLKVKVHTLVGRNIRLEAPQSS